ncbi:phosphatidate cytidylyltransferase [Pleionea sediminis]|uniref:phosphatidate cytidylyltransferase n=1 Tax=Pleionea sediminis TaxID=2569479 RepID=UPI0011862811|nr:phosphatidate cytidylyltransferase [Pleionea sediminis]
MLKQRIITGVLLLPVVGVVLFGLNLKGFALALLAINYLMGWEWARLAGVQSGASKSFFALFVSFLALVVWYFNQNLQLWPSTWFVEWHWTSTLISYWLTLMAWVLAIIMILVSKYNKSFWTHGPWFRLAIGAILIVGFWVSAISVRNIQISQDPYFGGYLVLYMLTLIWGADVGGYIFGKLFGKHKLAPSVSPGKTWEGFLGGLGLSLVVAFVGSYLLNFKINDYFIFAGSVIFITVISVFGDLFVSLLKRQENLKDTSHLLPGHGGILDRLDSSLAVAPFFLLIFSFQGWI